MQVNDPLYELVKAVVGPDSSPLPDASPAAAANPLADAVSQNTDQLAQLRNLFQSQIDATQENTRTLAGAGSTPAAASPSSGSGDAVTVANAVGGGLFLSPILTGILSLFGGGGSSDTPAPLEQFSLPAPVHLAADSNALSPADYGQNGMPRTTNVTVQVNAMDSQSFLDRSADIAQAVRRAMLESSSLNDVVAEL